jgi:hypothetical protein
MVMSVLKMLIAAATSPGSLKTLQARLKVLTLGSITASTKGSLGNFDVTQAKYLYDIARVCSGASKSSCHDIIWLPPPKRQGPLGQHMAYDPIIERVASSPASLPILGILNSVVVP